MYTVSEATGIGIGLKRKTKYSLYVSIISASVNLILNYLLVPTLGAVGAAIGTCISYLFFFGAESIFQGKWYRMPIMNNIVNTAVMFILLFMVYFSFGLIYEITVLVIAILLNIPYMKKLKRMLKWEFSQEKDA